MNEAGEKIRQAREKALSEFTRNLPSNTLSRLRFTAPSLEILIRVGTELVTRFVVERWFVRMSADEVTQFWTSNSQMGAWPGPHDTGGSP